MHCALITVSCDELTCFREFQTLTDSSDEANRQAREAGWDCDDEHDFCPDHGRA